MTDQPSFRLGALPFFARLGVTGVIAVILLGLLAAASHLHHHYDNRDSQPGFSLDDLRAAYHGIDRPSPLIEALESDHPEELAPEDRELLLGWLKSDRVSDDYDNLDLGDLAPAEVLDAACLGCHSRQATDGDGIGETVPLEYWDDVKKVAFSVRIEGTPPEIMAVSAHTHALALATLAIAVGVLLMCTRWPGLLRHGLIGVGGIALAVDLGGMWLARVNADLVLLVAAGGGVFGASIGLSCALVLAEMWLPRGSDAPGADGN
jgi:hypothetical protein